MTEIRISNLEGVTMPVHRCGPRSSLAAALATVFTQPNGMPPVSWHHQLSVSGASAAIAVRFCPFCGVELDLEHFE